jgi:hypothetical protein
MCTDRQTDKERVISASPSPIAARTVNQNYSRNCQSVYLPTDARESTTVKITAEMFYVLSQTTDFIIREDCLAIFVGDL